MNASRNRPVGSLRSVTSTPGHTILSVPRRYENNTYPSPTKQHPPRRTHDEKNPSSIVLTSCLTMVAATTTPLSAAEAERTDELDNGSTAWREKAGEYARIMSRVEWTPVAEGMPMRGKGYFEKGVAYTGVPYSSVREGKGTSLILKTHGGGSVVACCASREIVRPGHLLECGSATLLALGFAPRGPGRPRKTTVSQ